MWFEVLPSLAIVTFAMAFPNLFTYYTNRLFLGTSYKRDVTYYNDAHHLLRDMRLSGGVSPYIQKGLDSLSEEEPVK